MRRPLLVLIAGLVCGVVAVAPAAGVPEQSPKRGGTVVVGVGGGGRCLSPLDEACGLPSFMEKVLEPAFVPGPDSTFRPQLVTGATYTKTPFTVTFRIHPDARWSDGVPVTAGDFVFTHEAIVEQLPPELQGPHRLVRSARRRRREDREGRPASAYRRLAHPLLPRPSEACAQGPGPRRYLARRDRESPHGRTDRERPVPSLRAGTAGSR